MVALDNYESLRREPNAKPVMYQRWRSLLFLHFRCDPSEIQRLLPPGLEVDTFDGSAWVGLVPFRMEGVRPVGIPPIKWLSAFPETNVRTYVHRNGVPGVWFFSLEAANSAACAIARRFFGLPYHFARMSVEVDHDRIAYCGARRDGQAGCRVTCTVGSTRVSSEPGSLEYFLIERYLLYSLHRGQLCQGHVFHSPYPLQTANLDAVEETLVSAAGVVPREFEHVAYSSGVDVRVYRLTERRD
jgi:uncharacterized protein YqjF (DUF2071 family)